MKRTLSLEEADRFLQVREDNIPINISDWYVSEDYMAFVNRFGEECGIKLREDLSCFEIEDEQKFFLAKMKYGI